jgi:phosphate/sulfate permease
MSVLIGGISGIASAFLYANNVIEGQTWWQSLLIACIPPLLSIIYELTIAILVKKGVISEEWGKSIVDRKREKEDETTKEDEATKDKGEE